MKTLDEIRREINSVDEALIQLFQKRMAIVRDVAASKAERNLPVSDPAREREILDRVAAEAGAADAEGMRRFFSRIFEISRARQNDILRPKAPPGARRVCIVGRGLIGGSFEKAARRAGYAVTAWDRDPEVSDAELAQSGLVILALPPAVVVPWMEARAHAFADGAIVMDAAGVKREILARLRRFAFETRWTFVGGHPMAGREVSGYENSRSDLFDGASLILTPYPTTGRGPLDEIEAFARTLGFARVVCTTPERHDRMIALTSQLAHVISSAYVRDPDAREQAGFSAGSFKDMVRVAGVDPEIWTDLFLANADDLGATLDGLVARLSEYRRALAARDAAALTALLVDARAAKEAVFGSSQVCV